MIMSALVLTLLVSFATNRRTNSQIQSGAPWPMFGRNQFHTSNSPFYTNTSTVGVLRWKLSVGAMMESSPSIGSDGTIYFGTDGGVLFAVSSNGEVVWKYQTGGAIISTPALSDKDMIFVGAWDKYFYALQASTGTLLWKYKTGDLVSSSPVIDKDNSVYCGAGSNVYAFYDTGLLKWKASVMGVSATSPALSSDGILFMSSYFSSYPFNALNTIKTADGSKPYPPYGFGGGPVAFSSPTIGPDGAVYVGSSIANYIFKFNSARTRFDAVYTGNGDSEIYSPPALSADGGSLYFGASDNKFYAINLTSGEQLWNFTTSSPIVTGAAISGDGTIIFGNVDGYVYGLNTQGSIQWLYKAGARINTPAIGADGTVYVTSYDKSVYALGGNKLTCPVLKGLSSSFTQFSQKVGTCVSCTVGQSAVRSMCNLCPKGRFANITGLSVCFACTPGTYAPTRKSSKCTVAAKGSYVSTYGSAVSVLCANGTYSSSTGAKACVGCPYGSVSSAGASQCSMCSSGQYATQSNSVCADCPQGSYSSSGAGACTTCAIGTYAPTTGRGNCSTCNPGSVANVRGSVTCTSCSIGQYSFSASSCASCVWPAISLKEGSSSCDSYEFLPRDLGVTVGTLSVLFMGVFLLAIGILMVKESADLIRGIIVYRIGVFLFLLLPFLVSLSNIIYLFYYTFNSKILFTIFIFFTVFSPTIIFCSFLFIIQPKPRLILIILFPFLLLWIILGIILSHAKIFTIKQIWNLWFYVLTGNSTLNCQDEGLESAFTNRSLLYGSLFETIPLLVMQFINNASTEFNFVGILSIIFCFSFLIQCFLRFPFNTLNSPISHVPIVVSIGRIVYLDTAGLSSSRIQDSVAEIMFGDVNHTVDGLDSNIIILDCGESATVAQIEVVKPNVTTIEMTSNM